MINGTYLKVACLQLMYYLYIYTPIYNRVETYLVLTYLENYCYLYSTYDIEMFWQVLFSSKYISTVIVRYVGCRLPLAHSEAHA